MWTGLDPLERAGARSAQSAHVIVGQRAQTQSFIFKVELDGVLARCQRFGAFPFHPLQVDQVPQKHRLALEQVEAVAGKAPARGQDHTFGTARRHLDVGSDGIGRVQQEGRVALRQADHRLRVNELGAPGRDVRARCDDTRRHRGVQRQDLVLLRLVEELRAHLLDLVGIRGRDVVRLVEVLAQIIQLELLVVERVGVGRTEGLPRRAVDLGAEQPSFVVERPLAHHLEVLRLVPRRHLGVLGVEGVDKAGAFDGRLLDAVHRFRGRDAGGFEDGRHDVDECNRVRGFVGRGNLC